MAEEKKIDIFNKEKIVLQARSGFSLPVRYKGAWVRVSNELPVEFVSSDLPYEAKMEIRSALKLNHIFETKMPAESPAGKSESPKSTKGA
jgi:hypothetical protein